MTNEIKFDVAHTAVMAMDCQVGIVTAYTKQATEFIGRASRVLMAARKAGMAVIHIKVGFRPSMPEISERNKVFSQFKSSPQRQQLLMGPSGEIHADLGPAENDIVVTKHRVSAFTGTDLEMILRAKEIHTLALFGIATSGVVLSTLIDAFDADYRIVVIGDCCADVDPALHETLLNKFFPNRAEVTNSDAFMKAL